MAKKLEIIGNALVVTDTLSSAVEYEWPARDIYYIAKDLDQGTVRLYDTNNVNAHGSEVWANAIGDTVDSGDVTFTPTTFRTFARTSLGKTNGAGGATDLGVANIGANTLDVTSSTGTDATLPASTASSSGLMSAADKTKLNGIETGAQVNAVDSVNGFTGTVVLDAGDINMASSTQTVQNKIVNIQNETNTNTTNNSGSVTIHNDVSTAGSGKIITDTERTKLNGIEAGAEVNNIEDSDATDLTDGGETNLHTHPVQFANKGTVIVLTDSNNFTSNTPTNIPGLTFSAPADGDFYVSAVVNLRCDQNEEGELHIAVNGTTDNRFVYNRFTKNQDMSIQRSWLITGITSGDTITIQGNTRNDDWDLRQRDILYQQWG